MIVTRRPISSLSTDPANARKHGPRNLEAIVASLRRFGQQKPVVVDSKGTVRAGNGTIVAAKELGWTEIDVVVSDLDGVELSAYAIADNRSSDLSEFDPDILKQTVDALLAADVPLPDLGFTEQELAALVGRPMKDGLTDPDAVPAGVEKFVEVGDLWVMDRHRLVCGDSESADVIEKVLDGRRPELMVTDPPYGVSYDPQWREDEHQKGSGFGGGNKLGKVANDDRADWSAVWSMFPGDVAYCWSAPGNLLINAGQALIYAGFQIRAQIVWKKPKLVISRGHYHYQHEPCWYAVRGGGTAHWIGDRTASTIWDIDRDKAVEGSQHATRKPVECMARPMRNHQTEFVFDPFVGSGTSIIAAEQVGIGCLAVEIDPQYASDAVRRWENFTGKKAARC